MNVDKPNSSRNTCMFCYFKAGDSRTNLYIALNEYKEQIERLQEEKWRCVFIRYTHVLN